MKHDGSAQFTHRELGCPRREGDHVSGESVHGGPTHARVHGGRSAKEWGQQTCWDDPPVRGFKVACQHMKHFDVEAF